MWCRVEICLVMAAVRAALECPSAQVAIPATKSRYVLPSMSVRLQPDPEMIVSG